MMCVRGHLSLAFPRASFLRQLFAAWVSSLTRCDCCHAGNSLPNSFIHSTRNVVLRRKRAKTMSRLDVSIFHLRARPVFYWDVPINLIDSGRKPSHARDVFSWDASYLSPSVVWHRWIVSQSQKKKMKLSLGVSKGLEKMI